MISLYPHQQKVLEDTKDRNRVGYFLDMGLGKTYVGSEKMVRLGARVNLLICQKSKVDDWYEHFNQHYGEDYLIFDLTDKGHLQGFLHDALDDPWTDIVGIINYELAWRRKDLLNLENFTLMLDESSLIQNVKAKQTKFILKLRPANVILLSGSPTGGKYETLWSQIHLLGWGITEKTYLSQYTNTVKMDMGGVIFNVIDRDNPYKNVDRLKRKLRDHGAVFLKTEEVMDLPEMQFQTILVKKSKDYTYFRNHRVVTLGGHWVDYCDESGHMQREFTGGKELVGDSTLTQLLYSRQLCGQYSQTKLEAFKDMIQSTNDRLIVFYNFDEELEKLKTICQENERPISEVNGHTKDLTAYETEPDSVTLVQYQAGAYGLNLQKACRIVYFTLPLSSEKFEQSKKRIHRIGQTHTCFYYLLICRSSIEESILQTLQERKDYTDELFRKETQ